MSSDNTRAVLLKMPETEFDQLKVYAEETDRSVSATIRVAIRRLLDSDKKDAL